MDVLEKAVCRIHPVFLHVHQDFAGMGKGYIASGWVLGSF
jgi:hypothetical protein